MSTRYMNHTYFIHQTNVWQIYLSFHVINNLESGVHIQNKEVFWLVCIIRFRSTSLIRLIPCNVGKSIVIYMFFDITRNRSISKEMYWHEYFAEWRLLSRAIWRLHIWCDPWMCLEESLKVGPMWYMYINMHNPYQFLFCKQWWVPIMYTNN